MEYLVDHGYSVISLDDYYRYRFQKILLPRQAVTVTFHDGYRNNYLEAFPVLQKHNIATTVFLTTGLIGKTFGGEAILSWDEIRTMADHGLIFGSHTVTHPFLTRLSLQRARDEIMSSKETIEDMIGQSVSWLCYPYGDWNESVAQISRESGYWGACTICPGENTQRIDLFTLKTTEVSGIDTLSDFEKKLSGAYDLWHWFIQLVLKNHFPGRFYTKYEQMISPPAKGDQ